MYWAYLPSFVLWGLTATVAAFHTVRFYRFAFELDPIATPISAALVALFAAIVFPLAFFSVGAFALASASDAMEWLQSRGAVLPGNLKVTIGLTACGVLAGAFSYFVAFGSAATAMGAKVCISRHLMRSRSA